MTTNLWPHQEAAINTVLPRANEEAVQGLWVMPTGTGKTRAFCTLVQRQGGRALIVVHRTELIRQCQDTLSKAYPEARVAVIQGKKSGWQLADVCIASVKTLTRRLDQFEETHFDIVIIDEAHHSPATSWRRVIDYFQPRILLGCTATPEHCSGEDLTTLVGKILYRYRLEDGIRDGILVPLRQRAVFTDADLDSLSNSSGDFSDKKLEPIVSTQERCRDVVQAYLQFGENRQTIVFAANLKHVQKLKEAFEKEKIPTASVDQNLSLTERQSALEGFKNGKYRVLVNCQVLTEGYDEQSISCVIMARPTKSLPFYQQCVGRGLRTDPASGKRDCLILDIRDHCTRHDLATVSQLFGPEVVDCGGRDVQNAVSEEGVRIETEPLAPTPTREDDWRTGKAPRWPWIPHLKNFKPTPGWQKNPASDKQLGRLRRYGMRLLRPLTAGEATHLREQCRQLEDRYPEPSTPNQEAALKRAGRWVKGLSKRRAGAILAELAELRAERYR